MWHVLRPEPGSRCADHRPLGGDGSIVGGTHPSCPFQIWWCVMPRPVTEHRGWRALRYGLFAESPSSATKHNPLTQFPRAFGTCVPSFHRNAARGRDIQHKLACVEGTFAFLHADGEERPARGTVQPPPPWLVMVHERQLAHQLANRPRAKPN
jgi:hypothetical protein